MYLRGIWGVDDDVKFHWYDRHAESSFVHKLSHAHKACEHKLFHKLILLPT